MQLKNDLLIRAAKGEDIERTPVWLMRQAGRILPEYREIRSRLSGFIELVKTPELAAEVTIQPVDILNVDAAIIFSDILVIPEAMGLPYQMIEKTGPWFEKTVQKDADLDHLHIANAQEDLHYVLDAIRITKKALSGRVPLIGFAGAPWTIFAYMVEGKGSKTFSRAKAMLYTNPALSHKLLNLITESTINYLKAQIEAGCDLVQVFDSWAGALSPEQYEEFGMKYVKRICDSINEVPITIFAKGAFFALEKFGKLNCDVIGMDWTMPIEEGRSKVGYTKTLQGNMDPCLLYSNFKTIELETKKMLSRFGKNKHIANLGHGLYPDTNPDHVRCFIETVKQFKHE